MRKDTIALPALSRKVAEDALHAISLLEEALTNPRDAQKLPLNQRERAYVPASKGTKGVAKDVAFALQPSKDLPPLSTVQEMREPSPKLSSPFVGDTTHRVYRPRAPTHHGAGFH